ncbi:glycosyltransferase family 2 protein [Selenomonas sp. KH1T6]|uniref:tetratricopeptide repeat-containing glycosyltransferase family 2 protein n=1 Tax=Selenomonas sp. KH1T6 TaxID=3158784 RepID=UPI0008A77CA1|nr:Glycosyltransferase involved in cell wall bisynthesis [Selenomonas ruminantium]
MSGIRISACAIMRDEEKNIGRWLQDMRQLADEIIVVDTGSRDRTAELARAGGARVYDFTWRDDFAAAKNFALSQATGKWVLFLDADEYFSPESLPRVRPLLENLEADKRVGGVLCRWVNLDADDGFRERDAYLQMRVFRRRRDIRYEGCVHEALRMPPVLEARLTREIVICHTGYSSSRVAAKLRRNERLLRHQIASRGGQPTAAELYYLLDCAYGLQEHGQALHLAESLVNDARLFGLLPNLQLRVWEIYLSLLQEQEAVGKLLQAFRRAREAFPEAPSLLFMEGAWLYAQGQEREAEASLRAGLRLREQEHFSAVGVADTAESMLPVVSRILARIDEDGKMAKKVQVDRKKRGQDKGSQARPMRISACAIMKDEAENLPAWLESVGSFADEIIVVDTGSQDGTRAIAEAGGARVYDFTWVGDFAAAKNFAIEQATGDWIAFPDADEIFSVDSRSKIRPLLQRLEQRRDILAVCCRLVNVDKDDRNRYMETIEQIRLFRRRPELRYLGRIHEALAGVPEGNIWHDRELTIYHTGYSASVLPQKNRRNLELLRRKAEEEGRVRQEDWHYYMDCYYGLRDYAEAAAWAQKVIADRTQSREIWKNGWETYLSSLVRGNFPADRTIEAMEEARRAVPEMPRFTLMEGLYLFSQRDYLRAEILLQEGLAAPVRQEADNIRRLQPHALSKLGEMALWQGRAGEAQEKWLQALQVNRYLPGTVRLLVDSLMEEGADAVAVIELLSHIYEQEDAVFLAETMRRTDGSLYLYYARRQGLAADSIEGYEQAGHWGAAADKLSQRLALLERLAIAQAEREGDGTLEESLRPLLGMRLQQAWQWLRQGDEAVRGDEETAALHRLVREEW